MTPFESFLQQHDAEAWTKVLHDLQPHIHEVDRHATPIWFAFFPLDLWRALRQAPDPEALARKLLMQGKFDLREQIDSSHTFLYGHRYWPEVKQAVAEWVASKSAPANLVLSSQIREVAAQVAQARHVEPSLVVGITAVALMTLQQVGRAAFQQAPGTVQLDRRSVRRSPQQVLQERAKDDSQGLFGFLRTADKQWTVTFNENDPTANFKMIHRQEVASAAATHPLQDWSRIDPRCTINEGPIPVQCRAASCGTCWVGVLGGAEKLTEVSARERRQMKEFGYLDSEEPRPLIRLSCQAQGEGALSIVIPPWNGVFGKYLSKLKSGALEGLENESSATRAALGATVETNA